MSYVNESQPLYENKEIQTTIKKYFDKYPLKENDIEELLHLKQDKNAANDQQDKSIDEKSKTERPKSRERVFINRNFPEVAALLDVSSDSQQIPIPPRACTSNSFRKYQEKLPTWRLRTEILDAIRTNAVTLITGGTGCGKTTQIPQFLLEDAARSNKPMRIFCTQPRRLPTIAISKRVTRERGENLGATVGYHIRLERRTSPNSSLIYMTSGVLLRKLTIDELAQEASHIILDEIHEREMNTDYLLILLRQAFQKRKNLKLILMSATMEGNLETFIRYFEEKNIRVGHINVPARLFHVESFYLPEILALTNFMPKSECGYFDQNTMQSSSEFGNNSFGTNRPISSTRGRGSTGQRAMLTARNQIAFNSSGTEFFQSYESNGQQYRSAFRNEKVDVREQCRRPLPCGPNYFDRKYLKKFGKSLSELQKGELINNYLLAGGGQWNDSVDIELVVDVIRFLMDSPEPGAILVFLPGFDHINDTNMKLLKLWEDRRVCTKPIIFTLHSQMNSGAQQNVFEHITSHGQRKVVLSTNIAEASLTIDDIVFVIDCGKAKEKEYNYGTRVAQLCCKWIAKSNAEQRKGRAGRCQPGFCFRLYTEEDYGNMLDTQMPEIKRVAIYDVCINAKMFAPKDIEVKDFLKNAPDPPEEEAVRRSLNFLKQIGALYTPPQANYDCFRPLGTEITELGKFIAQLPLDPQLSRLLLFGLAFKCLNPILNLVAAVSYRDPFILTIDEEERHYAIDARKRFSRCNYSDHLMLIRLVFAFELGTNEKNQEKFCQNNSVSYPAMVMIKGIKEQIMSELKQLKLLPHDVTLSNDPKVNTYSQSWPMIQGVIVAGTYPNVGYVGAGVRFNKITSTVGKNCYFHPSSSLRQQIPFNNQNRQPDDPLLEYFVFQEAIANTNNTHKRSSQKTYGLRTVSAVPQATIALFAGPIRMDIETIKRFELVDIDGTLQQIRLEKNEEKVKKWREERLEAKRLSREALEIRKGNNQNDEFDKQNDEDEQLLLWMTEDSQFKFDELFELRGNFNALQSICRLKFRLMLYFTRFISEPGRHLGKEDGELLNCINNVLISAYKNSNYLPVEDLPPAAPEPRGKSHFFYSAP